MSYTVSPGSALGRLGAGIGQGLSTQIPEEIQRYRLSSGLKKLSETQNLNPEQYLAQAFSIPGMTPAMAEQFGQLARMRARNVASATGPTGEGFENQKSPFSPEQTRVSPESIIPEIKKNIPEIAKEPGKKEPKFIETKEAQAATIRPFLEPSDIQREARANELLQKNPRKYDNDINIARAYVEKEINTAREQYKSLQAAGQAQRDVQDRLKTDLAGIAKRHNIEIPANVYQKYENEALQSMLPENEGGEGLTGTEAYNRYLPDLDEISREYASIKGLKGQDPSSTISSINNLQKKFSKRDDLRNFADRLKTDLNISNPLAYSFASPIKNDHEVNKEIKNLPKKSFWNLDIFNPQAPKENKRIAKSISSKMTKNSSPLSIAQALSDQGYDPREFINYLEQNQEKLKLEPFQVEQLSKPIPAIPTLQDAWLQFGR